MPKVIVNSTPIIALANAHCLHALKGLFGAVTVPKAVFDEVTRKNDLARDGIRNSAWIRVEAVANAAGCGIYRARLHAGEMAVIALAQQAENPLLVMDDRAAKETAESLGLPVIGTLGVLLGAKEKGILPAIKPVLDRMAANGFHMSEALHDFVLNRAGEAPRLRQSTPTTSDNT